MNNKTYEKRILLTYIIIALFFVGLSFVSFIFNEWILPICVFVCSIIGFLCLILLLKSDLSPNDDTSKGKFAISLVLRYALMTIGLVISGLLVMFTMKDNVNTRYIMVAIAAVPYFIPAFALLITKLDKE